MDGTILSSSQVYFQVKEPSAHTVNNLTEPAKLVEVLVDGKPTHFAYSQEEDLYDAVKKFCVDNMIQPTVMCMDNLARVIGIPNF